jgi:hypothetical protein
MQRPPDSIVEKAQARAAAEGRAIYLYRDGEGWKLTRRLGKVPGGAGSLEIAPRPGDPERGNTGGC